MLHYFHACERRWFLNLNVRKIAHTRCCRETMANKFGWNDDLLWFICIVVSYILTAEITANVVTVCYGRNGVGYYHDKACRALDISVIQPEIVGLEWCGLQSVGRACTAFGVLDMNVIRPSECWTSTWHGLQSGGRQRDTAFITLDVSVMRSSKRCTSAYYGLQSGGHQRDTAFRTLNVSEIRSSERWTSTWYSF